MRPRRSPAVRPSAPAIDTADFPCTLASPVGAGMWSIPNQEPAPPGPQPSRWHRRLARSTRRQRTCRQALDLGDLSAFRSWPPTDRAQRKMSGVNAIGAQCSGSAFRQHAPHQAPTCAATPGWPARPSLISPPLKQMPFDVYLAASTRPGRYWTSARSTPGRPSWQLGARQPDRGQAGPASRHTI